MATATQKPRKGPRHLQEQGSDPTADGTLSEVSGAPLSPVGVDRRGEYGCQCGKVLRVSGGGRHRVYFEPDNTRRDDPIMNGVCPNCGRGLPGKNRS